jgi:amidase
MQITEYLEYDGAGLARLVRDGEVTPKELAQCAASQVAAWNPRINAVLELFSEPDPATGKEGGAAPFDGVPFLIKDLVIQAEGRLCEMGSRLAAGLVASQDSDLMVRFRQAGLVTLGRTATPEMGYNVATETVADGICRNPWDLARSPGGSSGGAAAAVAAGIVPLAHANDGGSFTAQSWTDHHFSDAPFTAVFNCTGQPAISLPLARSTTGLPIGIQFAARYGREDLLLSLAAVFEQLMPWPRVAPGAVS